MFSEMHIETISQDDRTYVDIHDLTEHLTRAMIGFARELQSFKPDNHQEALYSMGILAGMREIVLFLAQGALEEDFENSVHTLDDLMKFK